MANAFSKEERVAFEDILEGFQDALVLSRNVSVYNTDSEMMERAKADGRRSRLIINHITVRFSKLG